MISGAGGGGKSGGGTVRTPTESPNTLRSKQFARVLDLVCEGPIAGLVAGPRSVKLDGTPLQNDDGTYNFSSVQLRTAQGTQAQNYLDGFSQTETEVPVGLEIVKATPITKSITNTNVEKARITVSVPQLTFQNTTNGDLGGTSVTLNIQYQNNGGGFVDAPITSLHDLTKYTTDNKMTVASPQVLLDLEWIGPPVAQFGRTFDSTVKTATLSLERRPVAGGSWTVIKVFNVSGSAHTVVTGTGRYAVRQVVPASAKGVERVNLPTGTYEFRFIKTAGEGTPVINRGAVWVRSGDNTITGKTVSKYQRAFEVALPAPGPWDIKVTRVTADSTQSNLQNKLFWDSYTEIIDDKLRYPNSALMGIQIDASQFTSIPVRSYDLKLRIIKIPNNYNPITRVYTGTWNGTFTTAWSDNPAWAFYDMLINDRYGLGEFVPESSVDKWELYKIAQYCDELVDDGFGGTEPRFTINAYFQTQVDAYELIGAMASVFRGITYWSAGSIFASQDAPADSVALYTHANVIDGQFVYQGSSGKARHTVALVTYTDKETGQQIVEYVEDREGIAKYGQVETPVVAIGCNSRGQAHRFGRAILYTERLETETISFKTGMDGAYLFPGAIVDVADRDRLGVDVGGRVVAAAGSSITLDRSVTLGASPQMLCMLPDGTVESAAVSGSGANMTATYSATPAPGAIWMISSTGKIPEQWRVVSVAENDGAIDVAAIEYSALKYASIEGDVFLADEPIYRSDIVPPEKPINLKLSSTLYVAAPGVVSAKGVLSWTSNAVRYEVKITSPAGQVSVRPTDETSIDIDPLPDGDYEFRVTSINGTGRRSEVAVLAVKSKAKSTPPSPVENLKFNFENGQAVLTYDRAIDLDVLVTGHIEVRHSTVSTDWEKALTIASAPGNSESLTTFAKAGSYIARWVDDSGVTSLESRSITTTGTFVLNKNLVVDVDIVAGSSGSNMDKVGTTLTSTDVTGYWESDVFDLGSVLTSRLDATVDLALIDADDDIDDRDLIDEWNDVDGTVFSGGIVSVQVSTTNDDPSGSPTWSAFEDFVIATYTARAYKFRVSFALDDNILLVINSAVVSVDMPDRVYAGSDVVSDTSPMTITYPKPFYVVPALTAVGQSLADGDRAVITNKDEAGFDIEFKNGASNIIRTFDYHARGY